MGGKQTERAPEWMRPDPLKNHYNLSKKETVLAWVREAAKETGDRWERRLGGKTVKCGDNVDEAVRMTPKLWSA